MTTLRTLPADIISAASDWDAATIETWLVDSVLPCRLSCITGKGFPHVTSLWYCYDAGELLFSVQRSLRVVGWLQAEPRCGFEIAGDNPPYRGVRGRGTARVVPAQERPVLDGLIERYLGTRDTRLARWLLSRPRTEMTIRVTPGWMSSWDYGERMGGDRKSQSASE